MNHLIQQAGWSDRIVCDSAGTSSYHIGSPPDQRMTRSARERGIILKGKARQFTPADFEDFDLILAMDQDNYAQILSLDLQNRYQDKVKLMCEFCRHSNQQEVPDPYYGGPAGFNQVIDLLLDACAGLLEKIQQEQLELSS